MSNPPLLTPYQQMMAAKAADAPVKRGRKTLSDYQREQRRKAMNIANRRASDVLRARYAEEFRTLATQERHALVDAIDAEYVRDPDNPRTLAEMLKEGDV